MRILLIVILFVGCKSTDKAAPFLYEKLSKAEKDSLSAEFRDLSYYYLQTSKAHRIAKDTAILLQPDNIENIQVLSYSYKKNGEHIKAMEILNKAVAMDVAKGNAEALKYRAWSLLYFYRDYEGTIQDVDQIFAILNTKYSGCWGEPCGLLKGQALMRLKRYSDAISVLDSVLLEERKKGFSTEKNFLVHFYLGRCHQENKNYEQALDHYQIVLKFAPKYSEAHYQIGLLNIAKDNKVEAKKYLIQARELLLKGQKMGEPYFERFDELFLYQIDDQLAKL
jgi:tetratricopeptide (TPR) repeat protein